MVVRRRKCRRIRCAKGSVVLIKTRAEAMSREPRSRTFQGGVTENVPTFATHETKPSRFARATLLSHSAPSRMSASAMMRHAMRDENTRYHSLFAFSPERVLGLKRAAEVRVTTPRVS